MVCTALKPSGFRERFAHSEVASGGVFGIGVFGIAHSVVADDLEVGAGVTGVVDAEVEVWSAVLVPARAPTHR